MINFFQECIKYPRTYHLPWSKCVSKDDKFAKNLSSFIGKEVIISEKMDGENTTMYSYYGANGIHARSLDSKTEWYQEWCKSVQITIASEIVGYRLCGENMNAIHSIEYDNLESFFYLFSIWDMKENICLSWDDMMVMARKLDLATPRVIYRGLWDEKLFEKIFNELDYSKIEGYTIRLAESFHYDDFSSSLVKAVRPNHVQTNIHWRKNAQAAKLNSEIIKPFFMNNKRKF